MSLYEIPDSVFAAYRNLGKPTSVVPITMGLINRTYLVTTDEQSYILQEMSPIFDSSVTEDSFAVAQNLSRAGIENPLPYKTCDGKLIEISAGRIFRALKFINGQSFHTITTLAMAESAGKVVGDFHHAMRDFRYDYRSRRRHGGDYTFHQSNLVAALNKHGDHDFFAKVEPFANSMLTSMESITKGLSTTPRHVHGDPKVSNILFNEDNQALCLVDFDTLGNSGWSLEMADALRSWCNPYPEDVLDAHVDLARAEAALRGYGSVMRKSFSAREASELTKHTQAISLCLAMRFLADALNENYFGYDSARFSRASEHQWLKASAMYNLFLDFGRKQEALKHMVNDSLL